MSATDELLKEIGECYERIRILGIEKDELRAKLVMAEALLKVAVNKYVSYRGIPISEDDFLNKVDKFLKG